MEKWLGWIGSKESNRSRGFSRRFTRHNRMKQDYRVSRGAGCKRGNHPLPLDRGANRGGSSDGAAALATKAARSSGA
jgi:hypothetical protein